MAKQVRQPEVGTGRRILTRGTSFPWELLLCLVVAFLTYLDPIHIVHSSKSKKNLFSLHIFISIFSIAMFVLADTFTCCNTQLRLGGACSREDHCDKSNVL